MPRDINHPIWTQQHLEIIQQLAEGQTVRQVAAHFGISTQAVYATMKRHNR